MRGVALTLLLLLFAVGCDATGVVGTDSNPEQEYVKRVQVSFRLDGLTLEKPAEEYQAGETRVYVKRVELKELPYAKDPGYVLAYDAVSFSVEPGDNLVLFDTLRATFVGVEGLVQEINRADPPKPVMVMEFRFDRTLDGDELARLASLPMRFEYNVLVY